MLEVVRVPEAVSECRTYNKVRDLKERAQLVRSRPNVLDFLDHCNDVLIDGPGKTGSNARFIISSLCPSRIEISLGEDDEIIFDLMKFFVVRTVGLTGASDGSSDN